MLSVQGIAAGLGVVGSVGGSLVPSFTQQYMQNLQGQVASLKFVVDGLNESFSSRSLSHEQVIEGCRSATGLLGAFCERYLPTLERYELLIYKGSPGRLQSHHFFHVAPTCDSAALVAGHETICSRMHRARCLSVGAGCEPRRASPAPGARSDRRPAESWRASRPHSPAPPSRRSFASPPPLCLRD